MKKQLLSAYTLILIAQNLGANEVGNDAYLENDVVGFVSNGTFFGDAEELRTARGRAIFVSE
jgi:hypothetical protein